MKFKFLLVSCIFFLPIVSMAQAKSIYRGESLKSQPSAFTWTGFYVGTQLGPVCFHDKSEYYYKFRNKDEAFQETFHAKQSLGLRGLMRGFYIGYNMDFTNSIIFGVETDFFGSDAYKKFTGYFDEVIAPTEDSNDKSYKFSNKTNIDWNGATRLRMGYKLDRFLYYLATGVAYTDMATYSKIEPIAIPITLTSGGTIDMMVGWTIDAGIDYAAMDNVILRLEYRYNDYGKKDMLEGDIRHKKTLNSKDIRFGVAYKF